MFYDLYREWKEKVSTLSFDSFQESDVKKALDQEQLTPVNLLALLSPVARPFLEEMAQKAHSLTLKHFGKAINLFTPLYLANHCTNRCAYCGFNVENRIIRNQLTLQEVETEGKAIAAAGMQHLLLLTGESRTKSSLAYIASCVKLLRPHYASLGIEIYALEESEYRQMYEVGVDSMTMFQEVYDEEIYAEVHLSGPKRDYRFRMDAPERACRAGMSSVTLGALLGLGEWRQEAFYTALHAQYLRKNYSDVEIGLSLPRLRPHAGSFQPKSIVSDMDLVQTLLAYRLFLPRVVMTISTRESASFRDAILPLGITKMSAGARTSVGGYSEETEESTAQFEISDHRSVDEIVHMLHSKGYQPVFCDWLNMREGEKEIV